METYSYCTSDKFKKDIQELCEHCPLIKIINESIENQTIFQAKEKQGVLTKTHFEEYINEQIKNASKAMEDMYLQELQNKNNHNDSCRKNRIEVYIFNKERIKAYNNFISNQRSQFSVLEWTTIFYYAYESRLLLGSKHLKTRIEQFMKQHCIETTFNNFKTKYYEAKKRINKDNNYPISKLELIKPFLREYYKQAVTTIENDINFLEDNKSEY